MTEKTVTAPTKPPRSPLERAFVWGVIGIGLIVVGLEARAHFEHSSALGTLNDKLQAYETGEKDGGLTKDDVILVVGNREPQSEPLQPGATGIMAAKLDVYEFKGLMRTRQLYVYYGIEGKGNQGQPAEVMYVSSAPAETLEQAMAKVPPPAAPSETGATAPGVGPMGPGGMGGPGGPGAGGGRRRRNAATPGADGASGRPAVEGADATKDAGADKKAGDDKKESGVDKKDADAKTDAKPEEAKPAADATKPVDHKTEEVKKEEPKAEAAKPEEAKNEEPKAEETKKDEPKPEEPKTEEPKKEEPKADEAKKDS